MASSITRLDYCQFLLSSQINYTLTYFAEHLEPVMHFEEVRDYRVGQVVLHSTQ